MVRLNGFSNNLDDVSLSIFCSAEQNIDKLTSSRLLEKPFKRTISRLYELTSKKYL